MTGKLGECFANIFLSKKTTEGHLFRTTLIGGEWPTIDIYAEVIADNIPQRMFCFFQIKATELGYSKRQRNLKVSIDVRDLVRLSQYSAPTYMIGIDHNASEPTQSQAYIGTIRGDYTKGLASFPTNYPLTDANLALLRKEIITYWNTLNTSTTKINYITNFSI